MSPLSGYKLFPDNWAEHHRPTAEASMTTPAVFVRISDGPAPYPVPPDWDPADVIWTTNVRVQARNKTAGDPVPAEQPTSLHEYLVTAPVGGPELRVGEQGDVVRVLGRELRITDSRTGSQLWELDLVCTENLTQQNPA